MAFAFTASALKEQMTLETAINTFLKKPVKEYSNNCDSINPVVSVCVYTYNHERFIKECLDSLLKQKTDFDFEIYIGEDYSTDSTRKICIEYARNYPNKIRLFLHELENKIFINEKPSGRFNLLYSLYKARGKYIAWCEGDDYWTDENKLQKQVDFLENNTEFSLCFTNIQRINTFGEVINQSVHHYKNDTFTHEDYVTKVTPPTLSTVLKKESIPVSLPDDFIKIVNADMFLKAMVSKNGKVKFMDFISGCHRIHSGGAYSGVAYLQRHLNNLKTLKAMLIYFPSNKVKKNIKKSMLIAYLRVLSESLSRKQIKLFTNTIITMLGFILCNPTVIAFFFQLQKKNN